ncbi:MAG: hypothetical protein IPL53_07915 [Ignavibacteria bacterium]|nr:hypothetical protein [Ignavibacteria bacterium]
MLKAVKYRISSALFDHNPRNVKSGININKSKNNITELIKNADAYLHYSNDILFNIANTSSIVFLILLKLSSSIFATWVLTFILHNPGVKIHYDGSVTTGKIFDGVIERYCGVPP